jgi:hypothetical protein
VWQSSSLRIDDADCGRQYGGWRRRLDLRQQVAGHKKALAINGDQDPIGRTIIAGYDQEGPMTIIGIIGDVRQSGPTQPPSAEVLMPYEQHLSATGTALRVLVGR